MKLLFPMALILEAFICLATAKPAQESNKAKNAVMQERMRRRTDISSILKKGNEESKAMRQNDRGGDFPGLGCDDNADLDDPELVAVKMDCCESTDGGNCCAAEDASQQPVVEEGRWKWTESQVGRNSAVAEKDRFVRAPARADQSRHFFWLSWVESTKAVLVSASDLFTRCKSNNRSCRKVRPRQTTFGVSE